MQTHQVQLLQHVIPWISLGRNGKGQEGMGGYGPIVSSPCIEPGETHVLGKTSAKVLLPGCCVSKPKAQQEISPCQGQVKANKLFSPTSPGRQGGLSVTPQQAHTSLSTQSAGTGLKLNTRATQIVADQRSGPECSPQRTGDTELQRLAGTSSAPSSSSILTEMH